MKKQILFLSMLIMAVLAGVKSYGQELSYIDAASTTCITPTPLGDCAADSELNPIPGQTYTYEIAVDPTVSTGNITWFVYNSTVNGDDIISAGGALTTNIEPDGGTSLYLLDAEDAAYNTTTTQTSIDISWQSFDGSTTEVLLVAFIAGEDGCSDNIEVWRIEPVFAFTLDIAGLMDDGTTDYDGNPNANECASPVYSASYDGTNLTMDYGENYIYYVVNAANFVNSWQPTFTVENNTTETTVTVATDVTWAYPDDAISSAGAWNAATDPVLAQDASGAVGDAGECIIVRVHLDHGGAENDAAVADRHITLGVNGIMYSAATSDYSDTNLTDLDPGTTSPCTNTVTDQAQYDLTPRPNVTEVTPAPTSFEPKN